MTEISLPQLQGQGECQALAKILSNPSHIDGAGPLHGTGREQGRTQQTVHRGTQSRGRVTETSWDRKSGRKAECKAAG